MRAFSIMILLVALVFPSRPASSSPLRDFSAEELHTLQTQAAQGNAEAQTKLGLRYDRGDGVPQDDATARGWYEKAAAQGDQWAQNDLGAMYDNGHGVPQDYVWAYMWYSLAAENSKGDPQKFSANNRDRAARRMTSAQLAEAQRLSQQCRAQQIKGC